VLFCGGNCEDSESVQRLDYPPCVVFFGYYGLLPHSSAFLYSSSPNSFDDQSNPSTLPYTPLATTEDDVGEEEGVLPRGSIKSVSLSASDKWRIVQPLLLKYMLPLFCVYLFEYTINQGISPTLLYPVPSAEDHPWISKVIHSVRDYYPLWQV